MSEPNDLRSEPDQETPEPTPQPSELPEKFAGKSPADIAAAYKELESLYGRQARELGELRALVSKLATERQGEPAKPVEEPMPSDDEFLQSPVKAVEAIVRRAVRPLVESYAKTEVMTQQEKLDRAHPDWRKTVQSGEFRQWVESSPYRQHLYAKADQFDFAAAHELFDLYKEYRRAADEAETRTQKAGRLGGERSASQAAAAGVKKVYRREELQRLMLTDPERYKAMNDEIMAAYREGRVK